MLTYFMSTLHTPQWEEVMMVVAVMVVRSDSDCGQCQGRHWPDVTGPQYPVVIHHHLRSALSQHQTTIIKFIVLWGEWGGGSDVSDVLPGDDREG